MIAYNHQALDNLLINEEVHPAVDQNLISKEEADAVGKAYPVNLYMPDIFIRMGLFLLTAIIILMVFGFFCLLTSVGSETSFGIITLVFSVLTYAALEFFIREKNHFGSGIDDAMIWLSIVFAVCAVNLLISSISSFSQCVLIFILTSYFMLRFGNALIGCVAFVSFLGVVFYGVIPLGDIAKIAMPFLLMAISFFVYLFIKRYKNDNRFRYYKTCCTLIEILSLITLYVSGNYFVVREVSNTMFALNLKVGESVPGGWIFWITTILIPILYIVRGIQKRDVIILRTGLLLVAAIVCTIRYYYHLGPLEVIITISGIVMIVTAYIITKYLTPSKYGFTHTEPNDPEFAGMLQLESLIVAQTFDQTTPVEPDKRFDFGGGSGGGGGSTGDF